MKKLFLSCFYTLYLIPHAFSQWNANPVINTPVSFQPYDQQDLRLVTDSKGGGIISWLDFRNDPSGLQGDIFTQRISKSGINLWTTNGVAICADVANQAAPSMVEDGSSGTIIAWNDWRNGNRDIYAQKIDSSGVVQWAANGISIVSKINHQQDAKLISDGAGGAIIVWQDSINGAWDIYAQRVSSAGALLWAASGVSVCTAADAQINPKIETDGAGGAIVVWQDKRNGLDYDIYVQRVNASGIVQWTANGVVICNNISTQSNPKIEPDGLGGVIIAWQDKRNGLDYNVYVQRLNSAGQIQWAVNGMAICTAAGSQSAVDMTSEGISGAIISWKDMRSGNFDVYAQKIDLAGTVQWAANGIGIGTSSGAQLNPNIVGDGLGGAIIVWQDSSLGTSDIKSQRMDATGVVQWIAGGVTVASAADDQVGPKNIPDGAGGCIYAWQDKRNATDFDIYAHRLYWDGTAAAIDEQYYFVETKCFPNPFFSSAIIEIVHPLEKRVIENLSFLLFDAFGKKIEIPFSISEGRINILRGDIRNGIYFYEILGSNNAISRGKLILIEKK